MPPSKEATVVKNVLSMFKRLSGDGVPCRAHKTWGGPTTGAGEPDIDACVRGRSVKIELKVKARRSQVTELQGKVLEEWRRAGAVAGVATSPAEVANMLLDAELLHRAEIDRVLRPVDARELEGLRGVS